MANPSPVERLRIEVENVARSNQSNMSLTAVSPVGQPHSATVWFAPTQELDLLTLSAPSREHCKRIDACTDIGLIALVSGTIREDGQEKSNPCHGLAYEGRGYRLTDPDEIERAKATFLYYGTFEELELDKYLYHPEPGVPAHGVYAISPTKWTVFDGRLGGDDPARLVDIEWPSERILRPSALAIPEVL